MIKRTAFGPSFFMPVYHTILVYYIDVVDWQHFISYRCIVMYGLLTVFYIFMV